MKTGQPMRAIAFSRTDLHRLGRGPEAESTPQGLHEFRFRACDSWYNLLVQRVAKNGAAAVIFNFIRCGEIVRHHHHTSLHVDLAQAIDLREPMLSISYLTWLSAFRGDILIRRCS